MRFDVSLACGEHTNSEGYVGMTSHHQRPLVAGSGHGSCNVPLSCLILVLQRLRFVSSLLLPTPPRIRQ